MLKKHFLKGDSTCYDVRTTIKHWQLRDLLHTSNGRDFISVCDRNVVRYDRKEGTSQTTRLESSPVSITTGPDGWIATGGHIGKVRLFNGSGLVHTRQVSSNLINGLHFTNHAGTLRLLVSSNDQSISVVDVTSTLQIIDKITLPVNVNACIFIFLFSYHKKKDSTLMASDRCGEPMWSIYDCGRR